MRGGSSARAALNFAHSNATAPSTKTSAERLGRSDEVIEEGVHFAMGVLQCLYLWQTVSRRLGSLRSPDDEPNQLVGQ